MKNKFRDTTFHNLDLQNDIEHHLNANKMWITRKKDGELYYLDINEKGYNYQNPAERNSDWLKMKDLQKENIVKVVFRKYKDGQIIALFPHLKENNGLCSSYMRVGRHATADYNLTIRSTFRATEAEYKDLKEELESIGYELKILKKK